MPRTFTSWRWLGSPRKWRMKPRCTTAVGSSVRITSSNFFLRRSTWWVVDAPRVALPGDPVGAADLVVLEQPAGEEPALAARNPRDQDLFHGPSSAPGSRPCTRAWARARRAVTPGPAPPPPRASECGISRPRREPWSSRRARFEQVRIPLREPVHGLDAVPGMLGVPEWWPTGRPRGRRARPRRPEAGSAARVPSAAAHRAEVPDAALRLPFAEAGKTRPDPDCRCS